MFCHKTIYNAKQKITISFNLKFNSTQIYTYIFTDQFSVPLDSGQSPILPCEF